MTKSWKYSVWAAWGAIGGLAVAAIMTAIAVPHFFSLPLPWEQSRALEPLARFGDSAKTLGQASAAAALLTLIPAWLLAACELNPGLGPALAARKPFAWALALGSLVVLAAGLIAAGELGGGTDDVMLFLPLRSDGGGPLAGAALCAGLSAAAVWAALAPDGWAGTSFERRPLRESLDASWLRPAGLGALFGVGLLLGERGASRLFTFLFLYNIQVWHPSSLVRWDAMIVNVLILVGIGALMGISAGGLACALAPDRADARRRLLRCWPAVALLAAALAGSFGLRARARAQSQWAVSDIADAAGLPDRQAAPLTLVTLGYDRKALTSSKAWEMSTVVADPGIYSRAAVSPANAAALRSYLASGAAGSRWALPAQGLLPVMEALRWNPAGAFDSVATPGLEPALLAALLERSWLCQVAPITAANRARLAALSDETVYRLEGKHALKLAQGWTRFGDLERAKKWSEKSKDSSFKVPASAPGAGGGVFGRVSVAGRPGAEIRVGLFVAAKAHAAPYPGMGLLGRLVGSAAAAKDGSFAFKDLAEGRYGLAVLVAEDVLPQAKGVDAKGHPGIFVVAPGKRTDLGSITLAQKR